jgi:hypothetical protein
MRRAVIVLGAGLGASLLGIGGLLASCNAVLGIQEATLEPSDAGVPPPSPEASMGDGSSPSTALLYALTCANYCSLISTYCTATPQEGDNTEYLTSADGGSVCSTMCNEFEVTGEVTTPAHEPMFANTLNCRVWHVNAARLGDPHTHCPHAGPLGGTLCDDDSDPCGPFCRMDVDFCTGSAAAYTSVDDCLSACRPNPDAGYPGYPYELSVTDTEVSDLAEQFQAGSNTLNCRMYHLENYLRTGEPIHCSHTSRSGNGVCVSIDGG